MQIPQPLWCGALARLLVTLAMCLATGGAAFAETARSDISSPVILGPGAPLAAGIAAPPVSVDAYREALRERFERGAAAVRAAQDAERPGDLTLGTPDEAGGDDVLVATHENMNVLWGLSFDIAENGDLYAAVEVSTLATGGEIRVYRSTDEGDTWSLWGTKGDADPGIHYREPIIHVAEGDQNRVYLAYQRRVDPTDRDIYVSYAPSAGASAVWTDRQVMDQPGVDFEFPDLTSDAEVNGTFKLFLVATGIDGGDGDDLWFASSTDFGATWIPEYVYWQIETSDFDAWFPKIAYGANGIVHTTWEQRRRAGTFVESLYYRRAYNNGATYADFADTAWIYTTTGDAYRERDPEIAASHASESVVMTYTVVDSLTSVIQPPGVAYSTNAGYTFTAFGFDLGQRQVSVDLIALPGTEGFRSAGEYASAGFGTQSASDATPNVWSPMDFLSDTPYLDSVARGVKLDYNPTLGNRVGLIWTKVSAAGDDSLYFDAEWRADPGYPNFVPGFPMVIPADAVSPPALCELDGDPESEIVYGDADGNIQAFNHDGVNVRGWPKDIGSIPYDGAVAVGDLDGDGNNEVVCGNTAGQIYAFRNNSTPVPGWPHFMGVSLSAYASIGPLLPTSHRQVVGTAGTRVTVLDHTATQAPGWPLIKSAVIASPAAIGDVDGDGDREIVVLFGGNMAVHRADASLQASRSMAGKTFLNMPSLGDLNLDGDLEIVAPSQQGDLFVMNPDGTDLAGWPYADPVGFPITSVAIAQARAGFEPELAFGIEHATLPAVHARYFTNTELSGFPKQPVGGSINLGAPIWEVIDEGSSDAIVGSTDRHGWAWDNFGQEIPGWPKDLGGSAAIVSPASGDIDNDGDLEIVFLGNQPPRMTIVDVGAAAQRQPSRRGWYWPMYAYNAQRTACWMCQPDNVVGVGEEGPAPRRLTFHAPAPNPSVGAMAFRFDVPERGAVRLGLYDVTGRSVRELIKEEMDAGERAVRWDGRTKDGVALPAGVYYARLTVQSARGEDVAVRKVTLLP